MSDDAPPAPASLLSRRHFVIGGALVAGSAVAYARRPIVERPRIKSATLEQWVPANFRKWSLVGSSGLVLPPPDALSDRLYDNLVTRVYRSGDGPDVMLLLAYNNSQDGVLQVHRPEVCYPVGGFTLTETQHISVPLLGRQVPSNVFTATSPERTEQVIYFTRLGDFYPRSWAEQRIAVVRENLVRRIPDGLLVRVSLLNTDRSVAVAELREFLGGFAAAAHPALQHLLITPNVIA